MCRQAMQLKATYVIRQNALDNDVSIGIIVPENSTLNGISDINSHQFGKIQCDEYAIAIACADCRFNALYRHGPPSHPIHSRW
jgi:hypothetical protein